MSTPARSDQKEAPDMTLTPTRRRSRRRWTVLLVGAVVVLALLAAGADPIVRAFSGRSIGALMAEHDGNVVFARYDRTQDVPAGVLPAWFPREATAIAVAQPGPKAGPIDAVRVDAAVSASTTPAVCRPSSSWSMPFTQPDDWPTFTVRDLRTCDGWTLASRSGHWYLWRESAGTAAAN